MEPVQCKTVISGGKAISTVNGGLVPRGYCPSVAAPTVASSGTAVSGTGRSNLEYLLTTHINNHYNPHQVTAEQVGNTDPVWNANKIVGKEIDDSDPEDNQILQYSTSTEKWELADLSSSITSSTETNLTGYLVGNGSTIGSTSSATLLQVLSSASSANPLTLPSNVVVPGTLIARKSGGVAGTDEMQLSHDGSNSFIVSKDGWIQIGGVPTLAPAANAAAVVVVGTTNNKAGMIIAKGENQGNNDLLLLCTDGGGAYVLQVNTNGVVSVGSAGGCDIRDGTGFNCRSSSNHFNCGASSQIRWSSNNDWFTNGTGDTGIARNTAGIVKVTDGSTGLGGLLSGSLTINCVDGSIPIKLVRISDDQIGIRFLGHTGLSVRTNLILGGDGTQTDDGNARFWMYDGSVAKVLATAQFGFAFTSDRGVVWESGTSITGSIDTGIARTAAGQVKVTDGSTGLGGMLVRGDATMPFVIRKSGGVAGEDEIKMWHSGTHGYIESEKNNINLQAAPGGKVCIFPESGGAFEVGYQCATVLLGGLFLGHDTSNPNFAANPRIQTQITSDQNNYNPYSGMICMWSSDASRNVTGMVASARGGEVRLIYNVGTENIVFINASSSSSVGNRFLTSTGTDIVLYPNEHVLAVYDDTNTVWRLTMVVGSLVRGDATKPFVVRQGGGTSGDDEVQIFNDGTNSWINTKNGNLYHDVANNTHGWGLYDSTNSLFQVLWDSSNAYLRVRGHMTLGDSGGGVGSAAIQFYVSGGPAVFLNTNEGALSIGASSNRAVMVRAGTGVIGFTDEWTGGGPGGIASQARSPAQIAADTNNYAPSYGMFQRWSSDASRNVTGVVAGADGERREVWNVGSQNIVLVNNSGSSSAANRFKTTTGSDLTLAPDGCAIMTYDATSTVWRVFLA